MIVSHAHRFIFLKTRKTAGTSVEIALSRAAGPDDVITPVADADEELRREAGGRTAQNFDSPPLSRKAFNHMPARMVQKLVGEQTWDDYYKVAVERNPWDTVVSLYYWRSRDQAPPPFAEFVKEPVVEQLATKNARTYRVRGRIAVDRVLRYESLDNEIAELWSHLSMPGTPELPRAKGGARPARAPYQELYDEESRERVRTLFADAIAEFGYTF
ncbi:sulfotransferase family 2 domain-containing protein [Nocardioides sp.]|uniref:sulfotransferase family 2 domain-containing protein n=1 Tax=Nocardioides sp. TaxID=35761 RepID=UPI0031FF3660